jgi:2-polyprenyl-6-methoxyphenol hydroxylase-like FAD-dependent oxidoreductase
MAYIIQENLGEESLKDIAVLRKERLSQEAKEKFIKDVYNFPIKASDNEESQQGKQATLGDLIDATEPGIAATVLLEEKMFETWYHGRTVLIGDAVHKMHPASGQGCVNAMQDAVVLANCLYEISEGKEPLTSATITGAFSDYREQRYGHAKTQVEIAHFLSRFLGGMVRCRFDHGLL